METAILGNSPTPPPQKTIKRKKFIIKRQTLQRKPEKVTIQETEREDKDEDVTSQSNKQEIEDRYWEHSLEEETKGTEKGRKAEGQSSEESEKSSNESRRSQAGEDTQTNYTLGETNFDFLNNYTTYGGYTTGTDRQKKRKQGQLTKQEKVEAVQIYKQALQQARAQHQERSK